MRCVARNFVHTVNCLDLDVESLVWRRAFIVVTASVMGHTYRFKWMKLIFEEEN